MSKRLLLICFGALLGGFAVFSLPTVLMLGLSVYVVYICRKNTLTLEEKRFVTYACGLAIGIRIIVSLFILGYGWYSGTGSDIFGDAMSYEGVGAYIKEAISGVPIKTGLWGDNLITVPWLRQMWEEIDIAKVPGLYTIPGVAYWYAYFNTLWGYSLLGPKILNGLMWIIGSFWIYLFFRERFTTRGTKFGLLIILFLPSSLVFSSSGLKDSLVFLLMTTIIFSSHMLERSNHRWYGLCALVITAVLGKLFRQFGTERISFLLISLFIISILIVSWNRKNWLFWGLAMISSGLLLPELRNYVSFFTLIFGLFILSRKISFKKIFVAIVVITISILIISGEGFRHNLYSGFKGELRKRISESALQSYNTAHGFSAYHIYPERYYANIGTRDTITYREAFFSYLNGLRYVFLEPNPWSFKSIIVIIWPEVLFMWLFMPFIMLGIIFILRTNTRMALATILFLFFLTSLLALGQGNMGTLIRTRCMVMPWYFMIGALGLTATYKYALSSL